MSSLSVCYNVTLFDRGDEFWAVSNFNLTNCDKPFCKVLLSPRILTIFLITTIDAHIHFEAIPDRHCVVYFQSQETLLFSSSLLSPSPLLFPSFNWVTTWCFFVFFFFCLNFKCPPLTLNIYKFPQLIQVWLWTLQNFIWGKTNFLLHTAPSHGIPVYLFECIWMPV